jgi:hypothetical protein
MKKQIVILMMCCMASLAGAGYVGTVLFSDSYDRANNIDIDASSAGMAGTLSPMTYVESFEGSGLPTSIQIAANQLDVAYKLPGQIGMSNLYLDHNFTDAAILTAGGFSISLDVVSIVTSDDAANRYGGFGVGMTQAEAAAAGDINDSATTMRARGILAGSSTVGICDFFVDTALDNNLRVWSNGAVLATVNVGSYVGTIKAEFIMSDFNAGTWVTAKVYFNNVLKTTVTFDWDNTGANYIGISGRSVMPGVVVDNLNIQTGVTQTPSVTVSQTNGGTSVKEGDYSDELILSITSDPLGYPVTIDIRDMLDPNQVTITPPQVTFTTGDWQISQTVTITATDDNDMERETHGTTLGFTVTADPASPYSGYTLPNVTVNVHDNDCGTWSFDRADFNLDCQVNLEDFSLFAQDWVSYSTPDPECDNCGVWGFNLSDFNLDGQITVGDFSTFALEWIKCSRPEPECQDFRF